MPDTPTGIIQLTPGNIWTLSGGTRTQVKLSRPWQKDIDNDPAKCPFCKEDVIARQLIRQADGDLSESWLILNNTATPYPLHRLIVPRHHWDNEKLRTLGGKAALTDILSITQTELAEIKDHDDMFLGVHIGALAGQNVSHLHYHLLSLLPSDAPGGDFVTRRIALDLSELWDRNPEYRILQSNGYIALANGTRAGQSFVITETPGTSRMDPCALGGALAEVIALYRARFTSTEGLAPDLMTGIVFRKEKFAYGLVVPILNHWGATEYVGLTEQRPLTLPWPHEQTAEYLRTGKLS